MVSIMEPESLLCATDFGRLASSEGAQAARTTRTEDPASLQALEARVAHDLSCLNYPPPDWMLPTSGSDGAPMTDVLVVGAGMCGQTAAFALRREGLQRVQTIDARVEGEEGPWARFARMEMLRSPKHLTGPDLGIPSLTFRAWYEARFGQAAWQALHKVWRLDWRDYLLWVRRQVGVRVDNGVQLVSLQPAAQSVRVELESASGRHALEVRKLVLALGRDGAGAVRRPHFASLDPDSAATRERVFHSSDTVPFDAFRGRRIAVLGTGASAFDNAALALEHGAASVVMFSRRAQLPQVNKSKWTSFPGFFRGYPALSDAQRVRFYAHIFDEQVPPPFESVLRCDRHAGFELRLGERWDDLQADQDGVTVTTPTQRQRFDAAILGTGFDVNLIDRPELAAVSPWVMTWGDRGCVPDSPSADEIRRFPYLGDGFQLLPREAAPVETAQALSRIHLFNWGSAISHGAVAGDIPGVAIGANRLANALVRDLFVEDAARHEPRMRAHDEAELKPTRWWVPPEVSRG